MSERTVEDLNAGPDTAAGANYITRERGILSWLTTVDHKRIGLMYLASVLIAFGARAASSRWSSGSSCSRRSSTIMSATSTTRRSRCTAP